MGTETDCHTQNLSHETVSASFPSFALSPNKAVPKGWERVKVCKGPRTWEKQDTEQVDGFMEPGHDGRTGSRVPVYTVASDLR